MTASASAGRSIRTRPTLSRSKRASPGRRNSTGLDEWSERRDFLKTTAQPSGLLPVRFLYSHWSSPRSQTQRRRPVAGCRYCGRGRPPSVSEELGREEEERGDERKRRGGGVERRRKMERRGKMERRMLKPPEGFQDFFKRNNNTEPPERVNSHFFCCRSGGQAPPPPPPPPLPPPRPATCHGFEGV
ncbi:hypothetical protein EYF80_053355 [Liparis tanakae]|uniref:Uncharacterized protein n=1 Tax=Liparis tanakae TaxID=230148 RepID=A0A4Z2F6T8_9TELE|nr:hypothetical protein EYF80_053355 [Liparis tanakae]